jgi:hypothetical protein
MGKNIEQTEPYLITPIALSDRCFFCLLEMSFGWANSLVLFVKAFGFY